MTRARRHRRISAALAFGLLAFVAELVGRSLTHRIDVGRHLAAPSYLTADYYPVLLAVVKVVCALAVAAVAWRLARALIAARSARLRFGAGQAPRLRLELSVRLWVISFWLTALIYLVQTDAERVAGGEWPLLAPWLHSSALADLLAARDRRRARLRRGHALALGARPLRRERTRGRPPPREPRSAAPPDVLPRAAAAALRARLAVPPAACACLSPAGPSRPPAGRPAIRFTVGGLMNAEIAQPYAARRTARARALRALGPLTVLAGVLWAIVQPWRITLLHPLGQGFWWLLIEPPLIVDRRGDRLLAPGRQRPAGGSRCNLRLRWCTGSSPVESSCSG